MKIFSVIGFIVASVSAISGGTRLQTSPSVLIRMHISSLDLTLDPQSMHDVDSMMVNLQLFRGLFRYDADGEIQKELVERWTESPDHLTYVFKLKPSQFSNGEKITAEHVRQSFARLVYSKVAMSADLDYIFGTKTFQKSGKLSDFGIKVLNELELEFKLERKVPVFLHHLAVVDCAVLPILDFRKKLVDTHHIASSGPFKIAEVTREKLVLEKWRTDPTDSPNPPQTIEIFRAKPDDAVELAAKGLTDVMDNQVLPAVQIASLVRQGWKRAVTELVRERFVVMNPSTVSHQIRKYLFQKFSSESLSSRLKEGSYRPAFGLIPDGIPGGLTKLDRQTLDKSLGKISSPAGTVELMYSDESPAINPVIAGLKEQWETPEFKIKLKPVSTSQIVEALTSGKGELVYAAKAVDYPEGLAILNYFKLGQAANLFHMRSKSIDQAVSNLLNIDNQEKRLSAYRAIQVQVLKELTIVPLLFGTNKAGLWAPKFKTVPPHPMGLHTLPFESIEMAE